jgi:hypothetical protein
MKKRLCLFLLLTSSLIAQNIVKKDVTFFPDEILPGFLKSIYYDEQIKIFESPSWAPEVKFHINAPSSKNFDPYKKVLLIFFALPNGNTTDQTIGKVLSTGDDWHFDIQHIGAQTRFLRNMISEYNIVVTYLETSQKSWPTWRTKHSDAIIKIIVDSVRNLFSKYNTKVVISGHSGGGSFMFGFINSYSEIPSFVERIAFLDANYNYDEYYYKHGTKLSNWLNASGNNYLSVLAYNDSIALYEGKPIVSDSGGTWVRSKMMVQRLKNDFTFTENIDSVFWKYLALNGRIKFILKTNPTRIIYHTVQVEMNGFIQSILSGTILEESNYAYFTKGRIYSSLIQPGLTLLGSQIPRRLDNAISGSQFMNLILNMNFSQREPLILAEFKKGNIPNFLRNYKDVQIRYQDHTCNLQVMPDYLCIGSDNDFCRIPIGPKTAQEVADYFGCTMPTPLMVDSIWNAAAIKLSPVTHAPIGNANELVSMFITHNQEIEQQRIASGKPLGEIVAGIKKDIVLSNKLINEPTKVAIYGWHYTNGVPIQPLTTIHVNTYVDYSHGARLLNSLALLDGNPVPVTTILRDPNLYKILTNESGVMTQPYYIYISPPPAGPKSFVVKSKSESQLEILVKDDPNATGYYAYLSKDGITFNDSLQFTGTNLIINNLERDSIYYIKLKSYNNNGMSAISETLVGIPCTTKPGILIINGFDRTTKGNTCDFVKYHAIAINSNGFRFETATNDAVIDGLISLQDYHLVDYVLGDESTADETFSSTEQSLVKNFLINGGKLFVSGSEIAWDLDMRGNASDKSFCYDYLKMKYFDDAPLGRSSTYYQITGLNGTKFSNISLTSFDNGTHGTIDVQYPDAIKPVDGGIPALQYANVDTSNGVAGIYYEGLFGNGSKTGKLICFGVPFETIYPESERIKIMKEILKFFEFEVSGIKDRGRGDIPINYELQQNYPNPFNSSTNIKFRIANFGLVSLKIFDTLGREIYTVINKNMNPGEYCYNFNADAFSSGVYLYELRAGSYSMIKKMLFLR